VSHDNHQNPFELLAGVHDEASFIAFVAALGEDFARERVLEAENPSSLYGSGALGWENDRIDSFLEAASRGTEGGLKRPGAAEQNPWNRCAEILYIGKIYE